MLAVYAYYTVAQGHSLHDVLHDALIVAKNVSRTAGTPPRFAASSSRHCCALIQSPSLRLHTVALQAPSSSRTAGALIQPPSLCSVMESLCRHSYAAPLLF
jgi:hypothetical protein